MFIELTNHTTGNAMRVNLLNITVVLPNPEGGTIIHTNGPTVFYAKETYGTVSRTIETSCKV